MKIEVAYCSERESRVRLALTDGPSRRGHANLPDGADVVCLDYHEGCLGGTCPHTGRAGVVMGVRLARSHLNDAAFERIHARCGGCGQVSDLERIGDVALCALCDTKNRRV